MSSYCIYTIPIIGDVILKEPLAFHIDDLFIEFFTRDGILSSLVIECPIPCGHISNRNSQSNLVTYEPRANEIEEIVLQISNGFSLFTSRNIEILFENRRIEWATEDKLSSLQVNLNGGPDHRDSSEILSSPIFIRSVLIGCIVKKHDPALSFFNRGAFDSNSHRFIEAFYNFFFFLEYLYGNGKSGKKATLKEFLKSEELVSNINQTFEKHDFSQLLSESFLAKIKFASAEEILELIINTRGRLHHPNKNRPDDWNPGKQRGYRDETIFLQHICLEIAFRRYFQVAFMPKIERAFDKVQRCLRRGSHIRVVTK